MTPAGIEPATFRFVAQHLNHRATAVPNNNNNNNNNNNKVIPIVVSSTGVIPKSLSQCLTRLNLNPNTYTQMKKTVIPGTC